MRYYLPWLTSRIANVVERDIEIGVKGTAAEAASGAAVEGAVLALGAGDRHIPIGVSLGAGRVSVAVVSQQMRH